MKEMNTAMQQKLDGNLALAGRGLARANTQLHKAEAAWETAITVKEEATQKREEHSV
jgi:hypothetical protein